MQLESGKYYRDTDGCKWLCVARNPLTIYDYDRWICVSAGGCARLYSEDGITDNDDNDCNLSAEWPAATSWPPLDLSKPIVHVDGVKLLSVVKVGDQLKYTMDLPSGPTYGVCDIDGYSNGVQVLRQAVAKPLTQADVPFPWPVFRRKNCHSTQCGVVLTEPDIIRIRSAGDVTYDTLAKDWEHTTDGKTWKECCKWE